MFLGDQFMSAVSSNLQHLLPHLCSQLMVLLPISLRKQKWFSQYPHPTTTSLCPYTLPLGPIVSDLLKDVASASVPFLLQYHRGFLLYWRSLIIDNHVVIFPFEKKKKPSWLLHPIYLFPLTAELKDCLFPLFAVSLLLFSLKPTLIRLSPPPLHQNFSSHQWLHVAQLQWTVHGPHLTALSAPFLSVFAWRVHSTLCFWRMEWGSGLMKLNVWDMNKPIYKNMSYSYLPICLLWVNDDWWQSSSKEC